MCISVYVFVYEPTIFILLPHQSSVPIPPIFSGGSVTALLFGRLTVPDTSAHLSISRVYHCRTFKVSVPSISRNVNQPKLKTWKSIAIADDAHVSEYAFGKLRRFIECLEHSQEPSFSPDDCFVWCLSSKTEPRKIKVTLKEAKRTYVLCPKKRERLALLNGLCGDDVHVDDINHLEVLFFMVRIRLSDGKDHLVALEDPRLERRCDGTYFLKEWAEVDDFRWSIHCHFGGMREFVNISPIFKFRLTQRSCNPAHFNKTQIILPQTQQFFLFPGLFETSSPVVARMPLPHSIPADDAFHMPALTPHVDRSTKFLNANTISHTLHDTAAENDHQDVIDCIIREILRTHGSHSQC